MAAASSAAGKAKTSNGFESYREKLEEKYGEERKTTAKGSAAVAGVVAAASSAVGKAKKAAEEPRVSAPVIAYSIGDGINGYKMYLSDKEKQAQEEQEKKEKTSFFDKIFSYMGSSPDSTLPLSNTTVAINALREDTSYKEPSDEWKDSEKYIFGYLYSRDKEAAYDYAVSLNDAINLAKKNAKREQITADSTESFGKGLLNTAGSIAASALGGADYLTDIAESIARGRITERSGELTPFEYSQTVQSGIGTHLNDKYGTLDEKIPVIGGKGVGDIYGLATSIAQSSAAAYTGGSPQALIQFFGSAAAVDDARARGANADQAIMYGTMAGLAEAIPEMLSIESLLKIGSSDTLKSLFKNILKQSGAEGIEEITTSVLDTFADNLVMGDFSNLNIKTKQYMSEGLSEEEAKKRAWIDIAEDIAFDGLAGFVSGGIHAAPQTTFQTYIANKEALKTYGDSVNALIGEGLSAPKGTVSNELAQKYKAKIENGKTISGAEIRLLVEANENQFRADDTEKIKTASENRLKELGESGDVAAIAEILARQAGGEALTKAEQRTLEASRYAQRVANELSPENIRSGSYSSSWAENIGTDRINADLYNLAQETAGATKQAAPQSFAQTAQNASQSKQEVAGAKAQTSETTYRPKVKNAVQSEFKASESGKTINNITGSESDVAEIVKIKNGEMTLKLENGETVNAKNVSYGSQGEALIYETVAKLDNISAPAADVLVKAYNSSGNISADVYARGIEEAYRYGKYNIPVSEMLERGAFAAELTVEQRNKAYRLGQMFGGKSVAKTQAIRTQSTMGQAKKAVSESKKGRVHFDGNMESLNERQRTSVSALEKISKALGVDFYLFESAEVNGKRQGANGWYDPKDGSIHIDIYAGQKGEATMLFTAAHELTHFINEWSPAKFKVLANFLMQEYGREGVSVDSLVRAQQEKAARNGREISYDVAYEEVIADSMETMLADGNVIEKLAQLKAKDKTLWEKIKSFIDELVNKIREVYEGLTPNSEEGQYVVEMKDSIEKIQKLFTEGLIEAGENYQSSKKSAADSNKFSLREKVEETNDLVAVHNMRVSELEKSLDLGGLPMPSIAIIKAKSGHSEYGDVSLVFSKETIDPKANRNNKVYGGDAWTPVYPSIEYKVNEKNEKKINDKYYELSRKFGYEETRPLYKYVYEMEDVLNRAVGFDEVAAVILPDSTSQETKSRLSDMGINYVEYESGNEQARLEALNSVDGVRFSLREVEPVQPSSDKWARTLTTPEVMERFPNLWNVAAEESETRNPTQISGTVKSYRKIYDFLKNEGFKGKILDASSGLGYGTRAGIEEYGFDVEDIEPYPDKSYHPKYKDYSSLNKKYDVIISNAVLNVIPQDQRDALVVKMGELLNDGGRIFVNVRGKDVENASSKVAINKDLTEYYISNTGSYQKGFTKTELVSYLQDALGEGYTVKASNMFGAVSAVITKESGIKYSDRDYSYNALVSKPDMKVTTVGGNIPTNRADVIAEAKKNAAKLGKFNSKDGSVSVYVNDIDTDVVLGTPGLKHSLDRRFNENAAVTLKAGEIIQNSIRINELRPQKAEAKASYVLIGAAKNENGDLYIVRSVVNRFSNELASMDVLYAINAKKENRLRSMRPGFQRPVTGSEESVALNEPALTEKPLRIADSAISIANLLDYVNKYFPDILPEEALKHYGHTSRPEGKIGESALFQDRLDIADRNRAVILQKKAESLEKELAELERAYGEVIRREYEQNIKPNEETSKRAARINEKAAKRFMNEVGATFYVAKNEREQYLLPIINEIIDKGPAISDSEGLVEKLYRTAYRHSSEYIVQDSERDKNLKDYIRKTAIYVDPGTRSDVGDYNRFRKSNMGSLNLTSDTRALSLDEFYEEVKNAAPDMFSGTSDGAEQLYELSAFMQKRTESIGDYMSEDEFVDWSMSGENSLDTGLENLFDTTIGSFISEATRKEKERTNAANINRAMENVRSAVEHYGAAQAYAREEGFLAGQIEQGAQMANELRQKQESFNRKVEGYEKSIEAKRKKISELRAQRDELLEKARAEKREALANARQKAVETQKEIITRYQESRKKAVEGREQTAMRNKVKGVVAELNHLLLNGTKDRHVMIGLQKAVAEALDAVNIDTIGADERVAKYDALIAKANDPDVIASLTATRDRIRRQGDNLSEKIAQFKAAYGDIKNSDDPLVANGYDEVIASKIDSVVSTVGNTPLRAMSTKQLEDVYDMYRMVLTRIRGANESFKSAKKETISMLANRVMAEVEHVGGKHPYRLKGAEKIEGFMWNNLKPVYAFERIGSKTLTEVYNNVRAGEDTFAKDVTEAREFFVKESRKYHYDKWNMDKAFSFKSKTGQSFKLTIPQIMSLYAYSKRNQADKHLELGGFVFDSNIEVTQKKKGIPVKYTVNTATAHNISKETLGDIIGKLTAEQKAFVDEMQDFLSTTMGEKGNEVSLAMYGVKLFKEKHYFPLKSAKQFMFEQNETAGEVKLKNSGFSKETVVNASNPIILSNFMDVWANHVNDMSMYHSFVLPLEDFNRVFNYKTPNSESLDTESVKQFIQNAYGKEANDYIKQLITDLNGGAIGDPRETTAKKLIGNFKKAAVFASASVVIQQPSAIGRAFAIIDPKYFVGGKVGVRGHDKLWSEVKKYAPVAIIKEMGYFDTNMGRSTVDFITAKEYRSFADKAKGFVTDGGYRDEALSKAPALADEITWCAIWNAVKRETKANHKELKVGSEEFLNAAGARFTEVITKTQVYDSVLSRSANMRSKSTFMSMWTSFMGEPTTSINMIEDAIRQGKRGNKKYAAKAVGAVFTSMMLNSLLVSLVYAARDDDEDETYLEKYLQSLTSEVIEGVNPLTYLPFFKDVWSALQGFDIERADMSLITKLIDSMQQAYKVFGADTADMNEDELLEYGKKVNEAIWSVIDGISSLVGLPVKNIRRDVNGAINLYRTVERDLGGRKSTAYSVSDKVWEAVRSSVPVLGWGYGKSKGDKLYGAIMAGDEVYEARLRESTSDTALRGAMRDNDPRIRAAAQARIDGDTGEYLRLAKEIIADGFSQDNVVKAINAMINSMTKSDGEDSSGGKVTGFFKIEDYYNALGNKDQAAAQAVKDDIISTSVANGKTKENAEKSFYDSFYYEVRDRFEDGSIPAQKAKELLAEYGNKTEEDAGETVESWVFKAEHGFSYGDRADAYKSGQINAAELKEILMDYGGKTDKEAELQIRFTTGRRKESTLAQTRRILSKITSSSVSRWESARRPILIILPKLKSAKAPTRTATERPTAARSKPRSCRLLTRCLLPGNRRTLSIMRKDGRRAPSMRHPGGKP